MTEEAYRWWVSALYGGIAGGIGRIIPFPFDTIKRRMQAQVDTLTSSPPCGEHVLRLPVFIVHTFYRLDEPDLSIYPHAFTICTSTRS